MLENTYILTHHLWARCLRAHHVKKKTTKQKRKKKRSVFHGLRRLPILEEFKEDELIETIGFYCESALNFGTEEGCKLINLYIQR